MGEGVVRTWADILNAEDGIILTLKDYKITVISNSLDDAIKKAGDAFAKEISRRIAYGEEVYQDVARHYNENLGGIWIYAEVQLDI